jgi:2,5-diamino-6-(ribosylamino)-4(3H)-pyrimidinone 5'-phosphate reductase
MRTKLPHVICHMAPSVDGRIVTKRWRLPSTLLTEYERTGGTFNADAWMIGRVSMEPYAGKARIPERVLTKPVPRTDFVADPDARSFAVALDPSGKLAWKASSIDGDHVVTVLSERVSDVYLAFLRSKGVSYLFGGKAEVNLKLVLGKLRRLFGIRTLLLEGGGKINGSFLDANLIDELSVLVAPIADGSVGTPSLFDSGWGRRPVRRLNLVSVRKLKGDLLWLRYEVRR